MNETLSEIGEKELLKRLQRFIGKGSSFIRLFSEDCAVIDTGSNRYQLLTADAMVEGVHFFREYFPAELLGRKLYRINSSDVAAMGGIPLYFLISGGFPSNTPVSYIEKVYSGITAAASAHGAVLIGGNVSESPVLFFDLTLIGEVDSQLVLFRNGAKRGDTIFVSGPLGASAQGLIHLQHGLTLESEATDSVKNSIMAHLEPPDLMQTSQKLAALRMLSSMIDLSDGLAADLGEICRESGVGALVNAEKIPIADSVTGDNSEARLRLAIEGGEDYHLLFTVRKDCIESFYAQARNHGIELYEIGRIVEPAEGLTMVLRGGKKVPLGRGFEHFHDS